jgi:hypothetical protein
MTHSEALEKAAKLLRLAQSSNPHEAALAASRAQEIMDRFKLTSDAVAGVGGEIRSEEPIRNFAEDPLESGSKIDRWRAWLAMEVAKANQCKVYGGRGLFLIGRASDVTSVRYLYAWLTREIERLAARDCAGNGRTYWNNYRLGAVETVVRRLKESQAETVRAVKAEALESGGERALILVETSARALAERAVAVEQWAKANMNLVRGSGSRSTFHSGAREAGRRAGAEVRMSGARGSLNGGRYLSA